MATWLAIAGFLAIIGLPLYLMWGMPSMFRGREMDSGPYVGGPNIGDTRSPDVVDSGGDAGGGGGGDP